MEQSLSDPSVSRFFNKNTIYPEMKEHLKYRGKKKQDNPSPPDILKNSLIARIDRGSIYEKITYHNRQ
jgi:hypothetical protein